MLSLRRSPTSTSNRTLRVVPRKAKRNTEYVEAHASDDAAWTSLLLLGGKGPVDFRVRVAQAHAREDMTPSGWSHIGILGSPVKNPLRRTLYEIPLGGRAGIGYPPSSNGVLETPVGDYDDPEAFPNIAVLRVPVPFARVMAALTQFRHQRSVMDALELQLTWFAFVWGVGSSGNPLLSGLGVPSAAFVEYVVAAAGYDLVPGFPSRSSCPEAIWQAARWWHEFPRAEHVEEALEAATTDAAAPRLQPVAGAYDAEHWLLTLPASAARRARSAPTKPRARSKR
jgi:hypothetical protein